MPDVTTYTSRHKTQGWWRARLNLGPDPHTGKYRRESVLIEATTEKKAMQEAVIIERQRRAEIDNPSQHVTFADVAAEWWERNPKNLEQSTRRAYRYQLDAYILPHFGNKLVGDVTRPMVRRWLDDKPDGITNATRNRHYAIVRSILSYAADYGYVAASPITDMARLATSSPEIKPPSVGQVVGALRWLEERKRVDEASALFVLAFTGFRRSELGALRWCDVDFDTGRIDVRHALNPDRSLKLPKTRATRQVLVPPVVVDQLARLATRQQETLRAIDPAEMWPLADPDWFIWWDHTEGPTTPAKPDVLTRWMKKAGDALGYRINPQSLRHLAGSLVANERSAADGARLLGHSSPAVTMSNYIHADSTAAEANRDVLASKLSELGD